LFRLGATPGDAVVIGTEEDGVVFDWEPTMAAGAEHLASPRGTDARFEDHHRPTRAEKKQQQAERRAAKRAVREEMDEFYTAEDEAEVEVVYPHRQEGQ